MAPVVPFIPQIASGVSGVVGGLLGRKAGKGSSSGLDPKLTAPLTGFAGGLMPQASQGFKSSFDFFNKAAAGNPELTASSAADTAKQTQNQLRQINAGPRGGWQGAATSNAILGTQSEGLRRQMEAKMAGAQGLADLSSSAGQLGSNIYRGLLGSSLENRSLDLQQTAQNRDWYSKVGGGIFDILTGANPISKNSPLGKLGGILGRMGKAPLEAPTTMGLPGGTPGDWGGET